jgi:patatin-like phospholipase/acyl hydrolase
MDGRKPLRILSLDGGGVRGIASLYILRELMSQVRRDLQMKDSKLALRPCDYFDLICGTSTGGLIALMLGRLRYVSPHLLLDAKKGSQACTTFYHIVFAVD